MRILKSIFKTKDEPIKSFADFWTWFQKNENVFFKVVKIEKTLIKISLTNFLRNSPNLKKDIII